MTNKQTDPLIY